MHGKVAQRHDYNVKGLGVLVHVSLKHLGDDDDDGRTLTRSINEVHPSINHALYVLRDPFPL